MKNLKMKATSLIRLIFNTSGEFIKNINQKEVESVILDILLKGMTTEQSISVFRNIEKSFNKELDIRLEESVKLSETIKHFKNESI
jgi:hypothetical protein